MKIGPILRELKFGGDVAENDDNLDLYFVETSAFFDVIADEADLILGPKGSGKTAIFRRIADPNVEIQELSDVDILPAFNIQGSVIFRKLTSGSPILDEAIMRTVWMAYILGIAGNYLLDTYSHATDTEILHAALLKAGLRAEQDRPKSVWNLVMSGLRKLANPSKVESSLTFGDSGVPILTGKAEFDTTISKSEPESQAFDLEDLLAEEYRVLQSIERRCWIVFDRLDEAFQHDRDLERIALRGLLRAHLDICSYGRFLRTKLFLRTDILDRITEESGFVNVTHIQTQRIMWEPKSIVDLVAKRIIENEVFQRSFDLDPSLTTSEAERQAIVSSVLPRSQESQPIVQFIIQRTTDAHNEPNPRNVLTLLRLARIRQLQICDRDDPDFEEPGSLISAVAVGGAVRDLSKTRLEDTLFAEFNQIRPYVTKLRGRYFSYPRRADLAKMLGLPAESEEFAKLVDDLKYSGFIGESAGGKITVPYLYRAALDLQSRPKTTRKQQKKVDRREQRRRDLEETREQKRVMLEHYVRQMADEVIRTGEEKSLGVLDARDRSIVHQLVRRMDKVTEISIGEGQTRTMLLRPASEADTASMDQR